jgi:hypothetical protein
MAGGAGLQTQQQQHHQHQQLNVTADELCAVMLSNEGGVLFETADAGHQQRLQQQKQNKQKQGPS